MSNHVVRGAWFVAAREEIIASLGQSAYEVLVAGLPPAHQCTLAEATSGSWYPEEALQACLRGLRHQLTASHSASFGELLERCTERGMGTFFATLIRVASPRTVLNQVPRMWHAIRRGPGHVTVEHHESHVMLHYRAFPYFGDAIYEELTTRSVRALVRVCTGQDAAVMVDRATEDELDIRVLLD